MEISLSNCKFYLLVTETDADSHDKLLVPKTMPSSSKIFSAIEMMFTLNPYDSGILYWLFLLSIVYLYNILFVTLRLVFPDIQERYWIYFLFLDIVADLYYLLDVLVQVRTGYLNQGYLVNSIFSLAKHYIFIEKTFFFDIVSIFPLDYLLFIHSYYLPYFNIIIGLRVFRFLKYYRIRLFFNRLEARSDNPSIVEIVCRFVTLVNWIHIVACIYFGLSLIIGFDSYIWVYPCQKSAINFTNFGIYFPQGDVWQQYFHSLHWGTQIVTTIGEVPSPISNFEHFIVIFLLLCGIYLYATLIGEVGNTIQTLNVNRTRFTTRLDNVKQYMSKFLIDSNLQNMVVRLFDHQWITKRGVDEYEILEDLPKKLRAQIAYSANVHLLQNNFMFRNHPLSYQIELILHMKTQTLLPNEYIYSEGHVGNDMYIIREGVVQFIRRNYNGNRCYRDLQKGDYFGASSVINFDYIGRRREETAISKGYCSIWVLEKRILLEVLQDYPIVMNFLRSQFYVHYHHPQLDKKRMLTSGLYTLEELNHQMDTISQYQKEICTHFVNIQSEQIYMNDILSNFDYE